MKKHNVFLLFTSLTALLFCACSSELKEKENASSKPGTVTLSIANDTQRTISPAAGISYKDVREWTVTFKDITESRSEKYNDIVKTVSFSESANQQIQLPLGTYNVTLNGTANKATSGETATTQTVPFYGESTVTVEDGKSASISVFVAPKKSNGGTGSFNFEVITSGFGNYAPSMAFVDNSTDGENYFTVSLTPYGGENPVATWTPTEMSMTNSENGDIYSFSVSSGTPESIPSGFYTLSIKYTWVVGEDSVGQLLTKTKEIYSPYHDFLVEIIDGLTTNGSADITVSLVDSKTYYATTDKTKAKGNGAFESMPGYLDNVLDAVNKTTISTANIYIVDEVLTDETSTSYPEIDVSKVNATGKTYCIYTKSEKTQEYNSTPCYTITGAGEKVGEPTIDIERSVTTVTLKNSQSSSEISGSAKIVALGSPGFVLKDNTSVFIDLTDEKNQIACTTICMPPDSTTFDSYYVENPCVTVKNFSTTQTIFSVSLEEKFSNSYSVVTNSSDDGNYKTTNFYIIPSYSAGLSAAEIPTYSLVATTKDGQSVTDDTPLYAGDTVEIKATPEGSFADGTTFAWFINGEKIDCIAQSYEITFGVNAEASNTIICLAGYNRGYATAGINLTAQEKPIVLYNNTSDKTKPALSYATLTDVSSPKDLLAKDSESSPIIVDYCFDNSNNLYAIVNNITEDVSTYSIQKYKYTYSNNGYSTSDVTTYTIEETADVATIDYIEASSDDKLYAVIDSMYIAQLILTDPTTETEANGTVSFNAYTLPTDWSNIKTFCTDGTNFYVIVSITSYDDSQNATKIVKLVSCTVSGDTQLTENNNSILLASTVKDDAPVFSSSDYRYDALEYRDLCYINGKLYLLVRDVMINGGNYTSYSRGALCTFTVGDNGEITAGKMDTGYQKTSRSFSYTGSYDQATGSYPTITRTAYIGDGQSTFYGPVKFVARKQDELIIADDGFSMVSEESTDHPEKTQATVSSKNAVVTYNLNKESLNFVSLDGEYFEEKYSGYFYDSGFNETNQ